MPLTVYTPTVDEVTAFLAEHLNKTNPMMLVAVTDSDDPNWRGGDHINFSMTHDGKNWLLTGSNGTSYKVALKEVIKKAKKEKEAIEVPQVTEPITPAQETPPI